MKKHFFVRSQRLMIVLAFFVMMILAFISFTRIRTMNALSAKVNHSNQFKLILQETYSDLSDADSEQSNYILTSDTSYLQKMMEFEDNIQRSIKKIKALASGNQSQSDRVAVLDTLIQERFDLMHNELQWVGKDYKKISRASSNTNRKIISMIAILKDNESKGLAVMEKSVEQYNLWTPVLIFSLEVTVALFLIFAYSRADKELTIKRCLQKELEQQVHFTRAIIDNSIDLIFVVDNDYNLVMANKKCEDILSMTQAMIGKNLFALFPASINSTSHDSISRALKGKYVRIEKHKDQSIDRILESFFIPLYREDKVKAVIIIHHDITDLVKTSEELEITNSQLRKSNLDLEQFAYVASHDLQEPLRKVITYSQFAQKEKYNHEKLSAHLSKIAESAVRMSNLIKNVLQFSRVSFTGSQIETVDLNVVYKQVIQDLELLIEEKCATISSSELPVIDGYTQHLSQVFFNLIHNSIKYCDKQPVVVIQSKYENHVNIISFSDNGIGFDQIYKEQIFEIFKRIPNKNGYSGTGIGLAVCKKIIENHKGTIAVESEPGKGTTFELRLPARDFIAS